MAGYRIENVKLVDSGRIIAVAAVVFQDGKIKEISSDRKLTSAGKNTYVDGNGNYLVPGFIDLHIHGLHRYLIDNGPEDLSGICSELPQYGVTGFLPTVAPRPKGSDAEFLATLAKTKIQGTEILGFHLEGPFLTITGSLLDY